MVICSNVLATVLFQLGWERCLAWLKRDSQSTSVVIWGANWPMTTLDRWGKFVLWSLKKIQHHSYCYVGCNQRGFFQMISSFLILWLHQVRVQVFLADHSHHWLRDFLLERLLVNICYASMSKIHQSPLLHCQQLLIY